MRLQKALSAFLLFTFVFTTTVPLVSAEEGEASSGNTSASEGDVTSSGSEGASESSSESRSADGFSGLESSESSESETSGDVNEEQEGLESSNHPTPEEFFGKRIWDSFSSENKENASENEDNTDRNLSSSNPVYTDYIFGKNTNDKKQNLKGMEGQYTTSLFTGAATYSYPFELPPGRNGLTPSISLLYNSQNNQNNSVLGYGWDVSESYIERSDRKGMNNMYSLNEFKVKMNGSQSDIIPVFLTDQSHGEYGERIAENFWKYTFNSDNSWTILDKSGTKYTFGNAGDSRQDDPSDSSMVYRWYLTEVRDTNGNFIRYTYVKDSGALYPGSIYYTGHESSDGPFRVDFVLESRPDVTKSFRSGFLVQMNYRIKQIRVHINGYANGNSVRWYDFGYTTGDNGTRSLLANIQETSSDEYRNTATLPLTTFQYHNNASTAIGWTKESASVPEPMGCNGDAKIIDVNHDGYDDIVRSFKYYDGSGQPSVAHVYINEKNKTWTNQDSIWHFPEPFTFYTLGDDLLYIQNLLDFDGDFNIDLGEGMGFENESTYSVYYLTDTGWSAGPGYENISGWIDYDNSIPDYGRRQIDINADGFTDLVRGYYNEYGTSGSCNPPGYLSEIRFNDPSEKTFTNDSTFYNPFPFAYESDCWGYRNYDPGFRIVDVNGDGLSDVVYSYFRFNNVLEPNDNEQYTGVYLNNGKNGWVEDSGWSVPVPIGMDYSSILSSAQCYKTYQYLSYTARQYPGTYFMDVNGDGLNDMVMNTSAYTQMGYVCPQNSVDTGFSKGIYLNNGVNGWTKVSNVNEIPEFSDVYVSYDNRYGIGDINGDGLLDVIFSDTAYCDTSGSAISSSLFLAQARPDTDLLKTITNPVGGTVSVTYESSAKLQDASGNYLNPNLQSVMQVVKGVTYNDGLGTVQTVDYEYKDGKMYLYSNGFKEFGGFGKVTTKDGSAVNILSFYQWQVPRILDTVV